MGGGRRDGEHTGRGGGGRDGVRLEHEGGRGVGGKSRGGGGGVWCAANVPLPEKDEKRPRRVKRVDDLERSLRACERCVCTLNPSTTM
jgi:hypothetical protein